MTKRQLHYSGGQQKLRPFRIEQYAVMMALLRKFGTCHLAFNPRHLSSKHVNHHHQQMKMKEFDSRHRITALRSLPPL
jgi:hypothetical protein